MFRPVSLSREVTAKQDDTSPEESNMKKRHGFIKRMALLFLTLVLFHPLKAQTKVLGILTYDVSFPFGTTKEFSAENMGWRGMSGELRCFLKPNLSASLYFGLHLFYGNIKETLAIDLKDKFQGAITGNQFRYVNSIPLMLGVHYYTGKDYKTQAFFGLNAGVIGIEEKVDIGLFSLKDLEWHFGCAPEIGLIKSLGYNAHIIASIRYHYAFGAGHSLSGPSSKHSYLSLNVGLGFKHYFF
jgi:hypothetical protein